MDEQNKNIGTIIQVIGAVVDVKFDESAIPHIYNALKTTVDVNGKQSEIILEVQQHEPVF